MIHRMSPFESEATEKAVAEAESRPDTIVGPARVAVPRGAIANWAATGRPTDLPGWLSRSIASDGGESSEARLDVTLTERACAFGRLRTMVIRGAARLADDAFEDAVRRGYVALLEDLDSTDLLRAWNFIPRIEADADDGVRDRYMVFNAGRHHGFDDAFGRVDWFPAASGVGHAGDAVVVHLLHGDAEVTPVDNPRQVPPEAYSARFGHPTPVFARAARVRWRDREGLLVSGTASVVGEDSHHDRFELQLRETLRNLEVVVDQGWPGTTPADLDDWLVYLPDPMHADRVREAIAANWPDRSPSIVCRGQRLCRRELQVEIECAGFLSPESGAR
jgi:hypothetical protein